MLDKNGRYSRAGFLRMFADTRGSILAATSGECSRPCAVNRVVKDLQYVRDVPVQCKVRLPMDQSSKFALESKSFNAKVRVSKSACKIGGLATKTRSHP